MPRAGWLEATGDPWEPWRLLDSHGAAVLPVTEFLKDLQACGRSDSTQRSYAMALLRWFRFLWALEVPWDQATRVETPDYYCWTQFAGKFRRRRSDDQPADVDERESLAPQGKTNSVTGKTTPGQNYAATTRAHNESVPRSFYDFHRGAGSGPMVNPFSLGGARETEPRCGRRGGEPVAAGLPASGASAPSSWVNYARVRSRSRRSSSPSTGLGCSVPASG